jgi:hypothetical protein
VTGVRSPGRSRSFGYLTTDWVFGDVNSGDAWHYYQSKYAPGETVNPGIVGSDKTLVTIFSGDGKVHPVYITSAQISGDIRAQPSHRAFLLPAYIPVCKFSKTEFLNKTQQKDRTDCMQAQLFHECMHVVMKPLKEAGERAVPMIDSKGNVRMNHCFLAASISDKEEQALISCLGGN